MRNDPLPRLDSHPEVREQLLPHCRVSPGEIWEDPEAGHRVGCVDAAQSAHIEMLSNGRLVDLAIQDPPYNLIAFPTKSVNDYIGWSRSWVAATESVMAKNSSLYVWLGADQTDGFQPLPDFMVMMRSMTGLKPRSFITMRNQRGYGTQGNWMAIRQELLFYTKGEPVFHVQYTDIPKILKGYYKEVGGERTENMARSRSDCIRPGNVWIDVQQVFYRLQENVNGCYAQKPLKAIERIVSASSSEGAVVLDSFAHSGTSLLACERLGRKCFTADTDPIFCEITIRRLEHYRATGKAGWQNSNPFAAELGQDRPESAPLFQSGL